MQRYIQESFLLRFIFAAVVVFLTYNAEGFSYFHWIINNIGQLNLYMGAAAIVLVLAWLALIRASIASLTIIGFAVVTIACCLLAWLSITRLGLSANDQGAIIYIIELAIILVLSVGAPWSTIKRRFFPQAKTLQKDKETEDKPPATTETGQENPEATHKIELPANTDTILLNKDPE